MAGLIWLLGLASAVNGNVLDFLDNLTTRYMLPIGGLLIAIIAGWWLKDADRVSGFKALPEKWGRQMEAVWTVLIRYVTPILVLLVILAKMGLIKFK